MKKAILVMILILAPLVSGTTNSLVEVSLLSYNPVPAQPGDLLDVYIQLKNNDDEPVEGVSVSLSASDTFQPQGNTVISVGTISAKSTYVARFKVKVSPEAKTGDNLLTVIISQKGQTPQTRELTITIKDESTNVYVKEVEVTPDKFKPGSESKVKLLIESLTSATIRDLNIELDLTNQPFVPIRGTSRKTITELKPSESKIVSFNLQAKPDAKSDIYPVDIKLDYIDDQGQEQSLTETIGLIIHTEPNTQAYVQEVSRVEEGVEISVRIVNKGLDDIKFVEVNVNDGEGYDIKQEYRSRYVGNIESDDWETIRFVLEDKAERLVVPIKYSYQDAFNNPVTKEQTFTIIPPKKEEGSSLNGLIMLLVVVAIIAGIIYYKKKK